jgi:SAM-dependent methyltransferase
MRPSATRRATQPTEMRGPDRGQALEKYRRAASSYDRRWARLSAPLRRRVIDRLTLRPGDTVIDVACGTGLSFELLEFAVGHEGRVIGIDLSPEMLAVARDRTKDRGWDNVTLIEAPVEEAQIPAGADAGVFVFTHDVMRTPAAVSNVISAVKPGGTLGATGLKLGPHWAFPLNAAVRALSRVGVTSTEGLAQPWSHMAQLVRELRVETTLFGYVYVATAEAPAPRGLRPSAASARLGGRRPAGGCR